MGGKPFTLTIQALPLQVLGVGPDHGGNVGPVTLTVHGTQFTAGTTISLVPAGGGAPVASSGVTFQDAQTLYATFNLTGATPGRYNVQVSEGGMTATDAGAFTVDAGGVPGHLEVSLSTPRTIRRLRQGVVTVSYTNTGDTDIQRPLLELTARTTRRWTPRPERFPGLGPPQGLRTKIAKMGKVGRHSLDRDPDELAKNPAFFEISPFNMMIVIMFIYLCFRISPTTMTKNTGIFDRQPCGPPLPGRQHRRAGGGPPPRLPRQPDYHLPADDHRHRPRHQFHALRARIG